MKKTLTILVALIMALQVLAFANEEIVAPENAQTEISEEIAAAKKELKDYSIGVFARGKEVDFEKYDGVKPRIENNRTLVPIRAITEALGTEVEWDAESQTIIIE